MWLAQSSNGGGGFSGPSVIGPYLYGGSHHPSLSVRGEVVAAAWYTGVRPGSGTSTS